MQIHTKEHHDVIAAFEQFMGKGGDYRKEDKEYWAKYSAIYANGEMNQKFLAFRAGYAFAKCVYQ